MGMGYKVTTINDGKEQFFTTGEIPARVFGIPTWEKMKSGYFLPWIVVEEVLPIEKVETPAEYFSGAGVLPWSTEDDARR